jgi:hypothetical protein
VYEIRVLKIFGARGDEVIRGCRKLHNEELHNLYFSPCKITTIKLRGTRWARHVTRMGAEEQCTYVIGGKSIR